MLVLNINFNCPFRSVDQFVTLLIMVLMQVTSLAHRRHLQTFRCATCNTRNISTTTPSIEYLGQVPFTLL